MKALSCCSGSSLTSESRRPSLQLQFVELIRVAFCPPSNRICPSEYIEDYLAGYSHPNIVLVVARSKDQK